MNTETIPLQITNLHKRFGKQCVLDDVSLSLIKGEMFGLIGLNGVGKTTLIKIVLNLLQSDQGECRIFGMASTDKDSRKHLVYLPEKFQPSRHLTGLEYLSLASSYYDKSFDAEQARALADQLDLSTEKLEMRVGSYSKGMGQKLGLLSAILLDLPLLILDEPMSGLDPSARIKLKKLLLQCKAEGRTIFFSSHILSDIDEICDRIGVIHSTKLRYTGTPAAFKQQYGSASLEQSFLNAIA